MNIKIKPGDTIIITAEGTKKEGETVFQRTVELIDQIEDIRKDLSRLSEDAIKIARSTREGNGRDDADAICGYIEDSLDAAVVAKSRLTDAKEVMTW